MSIRTKLILSYLAIIICSGFLLTASFVRLTASFVEEVAKATIGDVPFQEVVVGVMDIAIELKYITKYDKEQLYNDEEVSKIEDALRRYDVSLYIYDESKMIYNSKNPELEGFSEIMEALPFKSSHNNIKYEHSFYEPTDSELMNQFILKVNEEIENEQYQFYYVFKGKEYDNIMGGVIKDVFRKVALGICLVLIIMGLIITKMIVMPLKELEVAATKIKDGQLNFHLNRKKRDEIGRVMSSFDIMREEDRKSVV